MSSIAGCLEKVFAQNSLQDHELGHYTPTHGHGHGDTPEYHVFHVEFERVEIPFIIALWIFVSSLAKIGEYSLCTLRLLGFSFVCLVEETRGPLSCVLRSNHLI